MRTLSKLVLLGVGGGAAALVYGNSQRRLRKDAGPQVPDSLANDPADPVQALDELSEFHDDELGVDAQSVADQETAQDLAALEVEIDDDIEDERRDALDLSGHDSTQDTLDEIEAGEGDTGDLYGMHTPPAVDRTHPDDDAAMAKGETWLEALQTDAVENGVEPERELSDIVDDEDVYAPPHPSDTRDIPVADRGSGGPGGA